SLVELGLERVPRPAGPVPLRVAALCHEAGDDPVEREPVVEALLRERDEALDRLGRVLREQLDPDLATLLHRDHRGRMHRFLTAHSAADRGARRHVSHPPPPPPRPHAVLLPLSKRRSFYPMEPGGPGGRSLHPEWHRSLGPSRPRSGGGIHRAARRHGHFIGGGGAPGPMLEPCTTPASRPPRTFGRSAARTSTCTPGGATARSPPRIWCARPRGASTCSRSPTTTRSRAPFRRATSLARIRRWAWTS